MNAPTELVDEFDLRSALAPLRPDPVAFAEGVRRRLREGKTAREETPAETTSPWLSVAASVIPLPLIGVKSVPVVPLSKLPLGAKLVGCAALPVAAFFAVGLTIYAWLRIRHAQQSTKPEDFDPEAMQRDITRWWGTYGAVCFIPSLLPVVLGLWGYTLPVIGVFVVSGAVMVGLVLALGRANAIRRETVAQSLVVPLILAGQLGSVTAGEGGFYLLDQTWVTLVTSLGMGSMVAFSAYSAIRARPAFGVVFFLLAPVFAGLCVFQARSLWDPIRTSDVVAAVESFDHAPDSSANWDQWAISAAWLNDLPARFSLNKPRGLLSRTVDQQLGGYCFASAWRGGLRDASLARRTPRFAGSEAHLLKPNTADQPLQGLDSGELHALVATGGLSDTDRDLLEGRLLATVTAELEDDQYAQLSEVVLAHELLAAIGRPIDVDAWRHDIHELIVDFQRVKNQLFGQRAGGFAPYRNLQHGDDQATVAAIRLMEIYGAPEAIDTVALRSFVRPSYHDGSLRGLAWQARFVARQRLAALPDLPPLTWGDYLRCEQPLTFASLLTLLALVAVIGSPASQATGEDPS